MSYYSSRFLKTDFQTALTRTTKALKSQGFGVLTDIDVKATLKKKLDVDFRPYRILGACHPPFAWQALLKEDKIGTMLPCNVVVQEHQEGKIEVAVVDPVASMQSVQNEKLAEIAGQVREKLDLVLKNL